MNKWNKNEIQYVRGLTKIAMKWKGTKIELGTESALSINEIIFGDQIISEFWISNVSMWIVIKTKRKGKGTSVDDKTDEAERRQMKWMRKMVMRNGRRRWNSITEKERAPLMFSTDYFLPILFFTSSCTKLD